MEFIRSIDKKQYSIWVMSDNLTIKVEAIELPIGDYKLEIIKGIEYRDYTEIIKKIKYGKQFKKNFETMKKHIDNLFKKFGVEK